MSNYLIIFLFDASYHDNYVTSSTKEFFLLFFVKDQKISPYQILMRFKSYFPVDYNQMTR